MEINKDAKDMDKESIVKQYWEIQRLRQNEENKELALKMSERQMELWDCAKKNGFHTELV
jgi:hypothetical protein